MELRNFLPKLVITYAFWDGLNISYQAWKNIYLKSYSKDGIDKNVKIIVSIIKKMLKLLIDRKGRSKVSVISKSTM